LVAAVAELPLAITRRIAFEIGAGQIIQEHVEIGLKQVFPALAQDREHRLLVRGELVQTTIQIVRLHEHDVLAEQIAHCKFARNNDPLRGDFRVQLRPPSYTVSVSLPLGLEGISGDDYCGHDWPNPAGLFRTAMADQEDRADSFGIARHGAQGDPRSCNRVQVRAWRTAGAKARRMARCADRNPGEGSEAAPAGTPLDPASIRGVARARL